MEKLLISCITFIVALLTIPISSSASSFENPSTWSQNTVLQGTTDASRYFSLNLTEPKRITVTLKNDNINRPFAVTVFDEHNNEISSVASSKADGDVTKTISSIDLQAGNYVLQIHSRGHSVPVEFIASYMLEEVASSDLEPNNSIEQAIQVPLEGKITGIVHSNSNSSGKGNKDYYTFDVTEQGIFTIEGSTYSSAIDPNTPAAGWYELYNDTGVKILDNLMRDKVQTTTKNFVQPGTYTLLVNYTNRTDTEMSYTLNTSFESIKKDTIISLGTNNSDQTAQLVPLNTPIIDMFYRNTSYSSWHHYYKISLPKDMPIQITASSKTSGLHIFMDYSYDPSQTGNYVPEPITLTTQGKVGENVFHVTYSYGPITRVDYTFSVKAQYFNDVPFQHPYFKEIESMREAAIIKGYPNGTFKPTDSILRKHVFVLLNNIGGIELPVLREEKVFSDLPTSHAYYDIIQRFYKAGIIDGSNQKITPESTLTRAQLAKILVNTFNLTLQAGSRSFKDVKTTDWYYDDVQILASNGITTGSNGYFNPNAPVSRQHFATFLYRMLHTNL